MTRRSTNARSGSVARRGFSLPEVLLAIFILGIGVISIAALFPAGIALQQQSVDDMMGPVVANNAMSVIRMKIDAEDIGPDTTFGYASGDTDWRRPAYYAEDDTSTPNINETGAINLSGDLFTDQGGIGSDSEVPPGVSNAIIYQHERYYPMGVQDVYSVADDEYAEADNWAGGVAPRPTYVWDCMFRRFQGRVLVAVFVYRVNAMGGGTTTYSVPPRGDDIPPLPISLDLVNTPAPRPWANRPWDALTPLTGAADRGVIPGTEAGTAFENKIPESWQAPGQWILDQNNNIHRVLDGRRRQSDGPCRLQRAVAEVPDLPIYAFPDFDNDDPFIADDTDNNGLLDDNVVTHIWYIPNEIEADTNDDGFGDLTLILKPVFVMVEEL